MTGPLAPLTHVPAGAVLRSVTAVPTGLFVDIGTRAEFANLTVEPSS